MQHKLSIQAVGYTALPNIDDVQPLSYKDEACIREMRAVLEKYDALNRFGVTLLHDHFPVAENELLVEYADTSKRVLVTRVFPKDQVAQREVIETAWRLGARDADRVCEKTCSWNADQGKHKKTGHLPFVDDMDSVRSPF